jgi:hypothetical protein
LESWLGEHYKKHGDLSCEYESARLLSVSLETASQCSQSSEILGSRKLRDVSPV